MTPTLVPRREPACACRRQPDHPPYSHPDLFEGEVLEVGEEADHFPEGAEGDVAAPLEGGELAALDTAEGGKVPLREPEILLCTADFVV
jgi:hypothetical protein